MLRKSVCVLAMLSCGWLVAAQPPPEGPPERGLGGERPQRMRGERGGPMIERMAERIRERLDLDAAQQQRLDQLVTEYQGRMDQEDVAGQMRALWMQMREARESGDETRSTELREQLQQLRNQQIGVLDEFVEQFKPALRPEQVTLLEEVRRERMGPERGGDRFGGRVLQQRLDELPQQLNLDETQRTRFDELRAQMLEQMGGRGERAEQMQLLIRELREAQQAGNEERIQDIRAQIRELRGDPGQPFEKFIEELNKILTPEQQASFETWRAQFGPPGGGPAAPTGTTDLRALTRAVLRLDGLTAEQRRSIREITAQAQRDARGLDHDDKDALAELTRKTRSDVEALLTAEQKTQLAQVLSSERPTRPRRDRPGERTRTPETAPTDRP